jgi:hypothetical protein
MSWLIACSRDGDNLAPLCLGGRRVGRVAAARVFESRTLVLALLWCVFGAIACRSLVYGGEGGKDEPASNDPALERRLVDEAPKAWERLGTIYGDSVRIRSTVQNDQPAAKVPQRSVATEIAILGPCIRRMERELVSNAVERVQVKNAEYAFALARKRTAGDPPYALEWLEKLGVDDKIAKRVANVEYHARSSVESSWKIGDKTILEWKEAGCALKAVGIVQAGSDKLVRVYFEGMNLFPGTDDGQNLRGYVDFDPANLWVIRGIQYQFPNGTIRTYAREYGQSHKGVPIATRTELQEHDKTNKLTAKIVGVIDETTFNDSVPSEFRLSGYGLPEPDFGSRGSRWPVAVYLSAGTLCLLIALVLWLRRRGARRATA